MLVSSLRRLRKRRGQFSLGGVKSGCCCASPSVCVKVCAGTVLLADATLNITGVGSCTTDSTGCCDFPGLTAGTYSYSVVLNGTTLCSGSHTFTSGANTLNCGQTSGVCCGGYYIPETLTLTDAAGSLTFGHESGSSPPTWWGGHAVTKTSCTVTTPGGICTVASPSSGPVRVCYQMTCNSGSSPKFSIERSWSWIYQSGTLTPIWYQDSVGFTAGQHCITAPPLACGSPLTDVADGSANPSTTTPFAISFSLTANGANSTTDPIGGGVTISQ